MAHKSPKLCVVHLRFIFHRPSPSTGPSKYSSDAPSTLTLHRYAVDQFENRTDSLVHTLRWSDVTSCEITISSWRLSKILPDTLRCTNRRTLFPEKLCFFRRSCIKFLTFCESNIKARTNLKKRKIVSTIGLEINSVSAENSSVNSGWRF